ncbi:hypothetical protein [Embleya sp. NBC_00896]|uniref:hypothetical protein n=1 Tax=Embleya sp. NBC_00896 TaxID=2975961 RepID=UPI002F90BB35|nr:hypothetical protein OG928_34190 [Embleya sp. NBC_00896]
MAGFGAGLGAGCAFCSTHELGIEPDAYDPKLDVDFTLLREGDPNAVGLDQAA